MVFEVTQVKNDTNANQAAVAVNEISSPADLSVFNKPQDSNLCVAMFDKDNPFQITEGGLPVESNPMERPDDKPHGKALPKELVKDLEDIITKVSEAGEFVSDKEVDAVLKGTLKEKDLLINQLRTALDKALGEGKGIGPAIEAMNKKLAAIGSPYEIKAEEFKTDGTEGFRIQLIDKNTGKDKSRFLAITWDEGQLERLAKNFSNGKFLSDDERDKTTSGKMRVKDTKMGELITTIQDAVARGTDPMKIVDSMNAHLDKSKSGYKIEAEKDGDCIRLRLVDRNTGKQSDKIKVPFEPFW